MATGGAANSARALISDSSMTDSDPNAGVRCLGPFVNASGADVVFDGFELTNCESGIDALGTSTQVDIYSSKIENALSRGVLARAAGTITVNCSEIVNNGTGMGTNACTSNCGGAVVVDANAELRLGTTSPSDRSVGYNHICGNRNAPTNTARDVSNLRAGHTITAENNYWKCAASTTFVLADDVGTSTTADRLYHVATAGIDVDPFRGTPTPPAEETVGECE